MSDKRERAHRYAQAMYLALLERWQSALDEVSALLRKDKKLAALLMDSSKDLDERINALTAALPAETPTEVVNLLKLLVQEGDLGLLEAISEALAQVASGQRTPTVAEITSAVELSDQDKEALQNKLKQQYGDDLIFEFHVDPSLMGGLRVRVGDRLIDTSIASRLAALRESLTAVVR
ncbi:ATP synthase F1 subunit delta [Litorilinea aerophila]|uniref:ATP synthase subunit delta n=1 Tax=Litorilinea aerophila TaxID=1204385 RepID=A0A540VKI9_9CHLR|nr:ATP synthase F1 subunit delta [Litorilinea aerophila]MCC9075866.1 ATP synthase F1 subunit delta [Litorilinea aerophila]GIV77203.1 MAG: hypothetical protein KatS3mg050_1597 [Litorilinea sp.]